MRDRLIELHKQAFEYLLENGKEFSHENYADYLLENGVIVPPVKVGQTVYEINRYDFEPCKRSGEGGDVCPYLMAEIGFGYECRHTKYGEKPLECSKIESTKIQDMTYIFWHWHNFGKTVFTNKEDAEAKLKEIDGR